MNKPRPSLRYMPVLMLAILGLGLGACTTPRYASTTEYDDVYYTSEDRTDPVAIAEPSRQPSSNRYDYDERRPVDSYYEEYYDDDDFVYSRRLRRFHQPMGNSFRYYDPFYTNDLYYVMGTPAWNRWYNQYGWYSWNNPRFAAPFNPYRPTWGVGGAFNQSYFGWNSWGASYYNPYISAYYGHDPFWGYNSWGWGNNFYGYGGWGVGGYCPPGYAVAPRVVVVNNNNNSGTASRVVTRRRNTAGRSVASQRTLNSREASRTTPRTSPTGARSTATPNVGSRPTPTRGTTDYLRPRPNPVRQASASEVQETIRQSRTAPTRTRPSSSRTYSTPQRNNQSLDRPTRTSPQRTSPSRTTPQRTSPSRTAPQRTSPQRSTPQRRNNYSSPSPSRNNSSVSRPSRSRSNSGSRSSSSSSRRRNN